MIFFVANDGTIINSVPSQVYQGSAEANDVYLIAPFATGLQVAVAFKLPNGVYTERYPMTGIGEIEGIINKQSGKPYSGWQFAVPNDITQYFGTVTAQFFIYTANGAITATSSTSFVVGKGVPTDLTSPPPPDVYTKIMENLSNMQQQLDNGWFTARAVAAWNSAYTYSGGDLVFYQNKGAYGVLLKSLTDNNNSAPYSADGVLDTDNWLLVSDFNILTDLYNLQTEMELAVKTATEKAQAAGESADNAQSSSQSSAASAQAAQEAAQSVQASAEYLEGIQSGTIAVAKAEKDGTGENIAEQFTNINDKIPSTASAENQLADKAFVNSSINNMAAFYITSNAQGDAFATRASLLAAATFYSGGAIRVPTQNDYAIVLADESQPKGVDGSYPTTRYSYQGGVYPDGQWDFQYIVNNTSLTQDQVNAINSGISAQKIASMEAATAAKYTKPSSGIPESDLALGVQSKLNASSSGFIKNLYNLGAFDTYVSNGDGTGTVTRKTGKTVFNGTEEWISGGDNWYTNKIDSTVYTPSELVTSIPELHINAGGGKYAVGAYGLKATYTTLESWLAHLRQNPVVVEYPLIDVFTYTERVIENQPIHLANQEEENYWHEEWRKVLNLATVKEVRQGVQTVIASNLPAGTYTLTLNDSNYNPNGQYIIYADDNSFPATHTQLPCTFSSASPISEVKIYVNLIGGTTSIMLNQGSYPYPYEPYNGNILREKDLKNLLSFGNEFNFFTQSNERIWIGYRGGKITEAYYFGDGGGRGNTLPIVAKELYEAPTSGTTKVRMYSPNNPPPLPNSRIALTLMRTNLTVSNGEIIADSVPDIEGNTLYVFIKDNIPYLGWCISPEGEGDYRVYTSAGNGSGWLYRIQIINS